MKNHGVKNRGAEGGFELLHHVDNTQLIDSAFGLKAPMPHNPASIVRLLYGERTAEEKMAPKRSLFDTATNSLTSAFPSVKATV